MKSKINKLRVSRLWRITWPTEYIEENTKYVEKNLISETFFINGIKLFNFHCHLFNFSLPFSLLPCSHFYSNESNVFVCLGLHVYVYSYMNMLHNFCFRIVIYLKYFIDMAVYKRTFYNTLALWWKF